MWYVISFLLFLMVINGIYFTVKSHPSISRRDSFLMAIAFFVLFVLALPSSKNSSKAEAADTGAALADEREEAITQADILIRAEPALERSVRYTKEDFEDTYKLVGPAAFADLNHLEPGAIYVAAESRQCDKTSIGAVSLSKSTKGHPVWYVDCDNGNRFMVSAEQAERALARKAKDMLEPTNLIQNCTTTSVAQCTGPGPSDAAASTEAQTAVKEVEVVTYCDMTLEQALVGDSSMAWKWNFSRESGDKVRVDRDFTAENAYGANLKHRYTCIFDAKRQRIESLVIEGPLGTQRVI